jgi:hypothetical protein
LRFIDSFRFMASSLEVLSNNLTNEQCSVLASKYSGKQFELLRRKGVYPYDYMDSVARFKETSLPPKEAFYSKLNDSGISDEDYEHAQAVWKAFGCKTLRDYHDLYNVSDVLLLADVFENFRDGCLKHYELDPAWYVTLPSLAWDAALKLTKVEMELISDHEIVMLLMRCIRGGISTILHRYAQANNKYMVVPFNACADEQLAKPIKKAISTAYDWIKNNIPSSVKNVVDSAFNALKSKSRKQNNQLPAGASRERASTSEQTSHQLTSNT